MELWIRSQDKNVLENVKGFCIIHSSETCWNIVNVDTTTRYGTYKKKERALEVLDEIQSILLPNIKLITRNYTDEEIKECSIKELVTPPIEDVKIQELSIYVYEMPKE